MSNAQITLFGYSTDSRTNDEPAAHSGGDARLIHVWRRSRNVAGADRTVR
jgi:hypothetical protein